MAYIYSAYFFILGLIVGSFLNCVIYRLEEGKSFFWGRSFCPRCKHILRWYDLFPFLSFVFLGGRCRYCKGKISWQYPIVEISTALLFLSIFNFQNTFSAIYLAIISAFLLIIFVYDLKHFLIPDKVLFPAIGIVLIYNILQLLAGSEQFKNILALFYSASGACAFFLLIFLVSRGKWMGFGDVKLAFFMGFFLGYPNILAALFLAFSIGAIIGIGMIIGQRKTLKSELPFGPFLIAGTFIALFWGQSIISWYLSLFNF